jgi:hypothetical protein
MLTVLLNSSSRFADARMLHVCFLLTRLYPRYSDLFEVDLEDIRCGMNGVKMLGLKTDFMVE